MSTQSTAGIDEPGASGEAPRPGATADHPSRSDWFVRGTSGLIGGPLGDHAVALDRPADREGRFWTAARIVLALVCLTLALHWVQKSPCQDGAWQNNVQYTRMCYTDVLALYYAEGLNEGKVPYADHPVEYPVLTGYFMGALGLPVHSLGVDKPTINQGQWFYNLNALVLGALAVATVAVILNLRRRRPWDAALFALAPALVLTATVNWDLLAVGLTAFGLLAWARTRSDRRELLMAGAAGALLGLGGAAKMWPLFLLGPILVLTLRAGRLRAGLTATATALVALVAVNLPVAIPYRESWGRFFDLNTTRPIDWGTLWYIGRYLDGRISPSAPGELGPFEWLNANIATLNWVSYLLFGLACLGVAALALLAPRRPRLAPLAFLVVAAFLIFSKVWSQQFVLWLLPLAVLARPRWGAFLAWQFAEVCYFAAFYGELLGTATSRPIFPEGVFVLASSLRLITVAVLCGFIIRDILRPEEDAVRQTYADDPDGGVLDGAPDAPWLTRRRQRAAPTAATPADATA
ncbi:glycosyltransferase 87 family protein [Micromonospora sp. WMMD1128]|uniref:glycosyltransferase family 87 protein n=1 Tax=Micromonospora sp. WMMD1128 TaxID=3015150 RepID=UPI00248B82F9|nr:glycosyltransferase 87 family protein [Micromonospora sp. WMMD1128]WBB73716.1 glycosyltransferase 87 family protein [Micromonospora sp. WMMD1128]